MLCIQKLKFAHHLKTSSWLVAASAIAFIGASTPSNCQDSSNIRGFSIQPRMITIDGIEQPRNSGGSGGGGSRNKLIEPNVWGQIEAVIEAMPEDLQARTDYIQELEVKLHWLTPEPSKDDADFDQRQVFSLSQTFSHVKPSKQLAVTAFIPPTWVERFGGASRLKLGSNVAVEVNYGGQKVIEAEMRERGTRAGDDPDWFKKEGKVGVLLPITQTPWMNDWWDRYYRPVKTSLK